MFAPHHSGKKSGKYPLKSLAGKKEKSLKSDEQMRGGVEERSLEQWRNTCAVQKCLPQEQENFRTNY